MLWLILLNLSLIYLKVALSVLIISSSISVVEFDKNVISNMLMTPLLQNSVGLLNYD